jgi:hypothetical protein
MIRHTLLRSRNFCTVSDKGGGCASPILWALLKQLLLGEKFDCIRLVSVDGEEEHARPGDLFVDDTTTGVTNEDTTKSNTK